MQTVFVTGANGLLGKNLIHQLLIRGFSVKGLIRNISKYNGTQSSNLILIEGDISSDLSPHLINIDYVVHCAAITNQGLLKLSYYLEINRDGVINLYNASLANGVKKFIFVSTSNTLKHGDINDPGSEYQIFRKPFSDSLYAKSKFEAEKFLLSQNKGLDVIILNPTFILGEFCSSKGSGRLIKMALGKKIIFAPPGGKNIVNVKDVAEGIINSFYLTKRQEQILLANENISYYDFYRLLCKTIRQKSLIIKIPKLILYTVGLVGELIRLSGKETELSFVNMKILCSKNYYTNKKSIYQLRLYYRTTEETIRDSLKSLTHPNDPK